MTIVNSLPQVPAQRKAIQRQTDAILIDVREDNELREGHAKGAVHLSRVTIEFEFQDHAAAMNTPIILCCGRGRRSALVADNLQKMGCINAVIVVSGFEAWSAAGLPVERSD